MRILRHLFLEDLIELHAVRSDQLLLQGGGLEGDRDVIGVR